MENFGFIVKCDPVKCNSLWCFLVCTIKNINLTLFLHFIYSNSFHHYYSWRPILTYFLYLVHLHQIPITLSMFQMSYTKGFISERWARRRDYRHTLNTFFALLFTLLGICRSNLCMHEVCRSAKNRLGILKLCTKLAVENRDGRAKVF